MLQVAPTIIKNWIDRSFISIVSAPFFESMVSNVKCRWSPGQKPHSKECDGNLHEAISNLYTWAMTYEKSSESVVDQSLRIILERFTECGIKIPN